MPLTAAAWPLNVSDEARQLAAGLLQTPAPQRATLTTADIGNFAANCLARMRDDGDRLLAEANTYAGETRAYTASRRISDRMEQAGNVGILALLVDRHGDHATATAIEADINATTLKLIDQAHTARGLSIPTVPA